MGGTPCPDRAAYWALEQDGVTIPDDVLDRAVR